MIDPDFTELCKQLEHFETPEWAAQEILKHEILTQDVVDPCAGTGVLFKAAKQAGYKPIAYDIHLWEPFEKHIRQADFLKLNTFPLKNTTVFMNPPFSLACEFVEKSFELGARKIVCFQRFAWWESADRRDWWFNFPPNRIYICGNRASCWRHDLPKDEKGNRYDPKTGKKLSSSPTAHAWFIWEKGNPQGTQLGHIYKGGA